MKQIKQIKWERPSHLPEMVSGLTLPQASCARVTQSPFYEIYHKALNQDGHTLNSAGVKMWTRPIKKLLNLWNILRSMVNALHRLPIAHRTTNPFNHMVCKKRTSIPKKYLHSTEDSIYNKMKNFVGVGGYLGCILITLSLFTMPRAPYMAHFKGF